MKSSIQVPTFSVVIPTYNRAGMLPDTVRAALQQTVPPVDVIVVDDGSTDDTREVVQQFGSQVTYVYQSNAERAVARNKGASRARGSHIAFLDSDDSWLPDHFQRVSAAIDADTPFAYTSAAYRFPDGSRIPHGARYRSGWVTRHLIRGNFVAGNAAVVSGEAFQRVGGFCSDRRVIGSEDWELWTRLSVFYPFVHVPVGTAEILVHSERTSYDARVLERCKLAALEALFDNPLTRDVLGPYRREAWFYGYLFVALAFYRADEQSRAREYLRLALRVWPRGALDPRLGATFLKSFLGRSVVERVRRALGLRQA